MKLFNPIAALAALAATAHFASAEVSTQGIVENLQANGFTGIEITVGPSQVKAEGYNPNGTKIEVVYDRATGKIHKQETSRLRAGETIREGVEMQNGSDDFLDDSEDDHDMSDDDSSDDDGMSDDDGPDHDSSDDDSSDHDSSDDGGSDDGASDDGGSDDGGDDD